MKPRRRDAREHAVWRRLPAILFWGTALPLLCSGLWHWTVQPERARLDLHGLSLADYALIGVVVCHWTMVFTAGIACRIVMVINGPVQRADPYPLPELAGEQAGERLQPPAAHLRRGQPGHDRS